jgi:hypothetical protein
MKLEIDRILTVSTGHVNAQDTEVLDDPKYELVSHKYEYGWLVWAGDSEAYYPALSAFANHLIAIARKHDCEWLRLDQAGDEIDGLQLFEW